MGMSNWDAILDEAERLSNQLLQQNVDLAEAQKLLDYFVYKGYDSAAVSKYLAQMSQNPPPRSKRSQEHFQNLKRIWNNWLTNLEGENKAQAWGWAVRKAKIRKTESAEAR